MIDNFLNSIRANYQMFRRMIFWGLNLRNNYDFDAETIYDILYLKLQRLYVTFNKNGHLVWNSSPDNKRMRKLSEAILLCKRLRSNYHDDLAFEELEQKFGPVSFKDLFIQKPLERIAYHNELKKLLTRSGKLKLAEKERFFKLLKENISIWWD